MRSLLVASIGAALLLLAGQSMATPVTIFAGAQFDSVSGEFFDSQPISAPGTLTPFDSSLGTLLSVRLWTGGTGAAGATLIDLLPGNYGVQVWATFSLLGPGDLLLHTLDQPQGGATFTMYEDGTSDSIWADDDTAAFSAYVHDGNAIGSPLQGIAAGLDYFLSPSQFTVSVDYFLKVSGPGFSLAGTVVDPDVTYLDFGVGGVYYTYEPIPEPSTALLVGLGLLAIGATRSRRMT